MESIHQEKVSSKTETTGSLTEGSRLEVIPLTGHTSYFYDNWESINASSQVLNVISGYKIPFVKEPYQYHHPMAQANSDEERILIEEEINNLLAKDAIEEIPMSELYYSSSMFLVTKKAGGRRPVLNLKPLNKFVPNQTFKMEGIHLLKDFLKHNYFMTKLIIMLIILYLLISIPDVIYSLYLRGNFTNFKRFWYLV